MVGDIFDYLVNFKVTNFETRDFYTIINAFLKNSCNAWRILNGFLCRSTIEATLTVGPLRSLKSLYMYQWRIYKVKF